MKKYRGLVGMFVLLSASLACQTLTGGAATPTFNPDSVATVEVFTESPTESPSGNTNDSSNPNVDSELFPMPSDAENLIEMGEDTVIFQTKLSLEEAMDFYRDAYGGQGYAERDLLTVTSEQTFSMVFDGHPSGQAIVVQGVDLGDGSTNITITLQDI